MTILSKLVGRWSRLRGTRPVEPVLRARFAARLRGSGIEIGPLASPLWLPSGTAVSYVDKFGYEKLCQLNPDVPAAEIRPPHLVCDAMSLESIPERSCDFVVACHLLEHAHDPIRALLAWHRVLRPGGLVLCIVPDARYTFDRGRQLTPLEHLLWDYENAGSEQKRLSDLFHAAECNLNMHQSLDAAAALDLAREILSVSYDTHFHVWTHETLVAQLATLIAEHGLPFALRESACDGRVEMLLLLEAVPGDASRFRRGGGASPAGVCTPAGTRSPEAGATSSPA